MELASITFFLGGMYMKKYKNVVLFLLIVLVFSLTIRINTLPVLVDGRSMEPTLYDHDFFLSNRNSIKSLKRFDIVVAYSHQLNENIVKRVIGMPFDKMEYRDNKLYINGQYIKEPFLQDSMTNDFTITLKKNQYFLMGDNRLHSTDSRELGPFSLQDISSRDGVIVFPLSHFKKIQ